MDLVKKLKIFHVFLFGKIGQENVFDDVLSRKKAFLHKKQKFKKTKIWDFSKGLVQGFGQKLDSFHLFFFSTKWARKKCLTIFKN